MGINNASYTKTKWTDGWTNQQMNQWNKQTNWAVNLPSYVVQSESDGYICVHGWRIDCNPHTTAGSSLDTEKKISQLQ